MGRDVTGTPGRGTKLHPPFAQPDPGRRAEPAEESLPVMSEQFVPEPIGASTTWSAEENLPSIDEFLDDLPSIDDFVDHREEWSDAGDSEQSEEGWAAADWQSFDWRGAASLGTAPKEEAEAHAAWSRTDWGGTGSSRDYGAATSAAEIASALDTLAHRIRTGEISLEQFRGTPPEAVIAAAFAALLRSRA
ncbi:MAG TPA: hypothetical protein VIF83_09600 [Gemmatimonadaceae bacterium]|jgi:hypothetical protein